MKQAKNVLIISYFANESGMACSHHIDDRLDYFKAIQFNITLLTSFFVSKSKLVKHLRAIIITPSGLRFEIKSRLKKHLPRWIYKILCPIILLPILPFYFLEKAVVNIDATWGWTFGAAITGLILSSFNRPDIIYSTGGPISAHMAAVLISRITGIPWVAEFQDPLIHSYCARSNFELKLTYWSERYICKHAQRVIFLTRNAEEMARSRTELGQRGKVIYPGAIKEGEDNLRYVKGEHLRFVHFGSLVGVRNLQYFILGLETFLDREPDIAKILRIDLCGELGKDVLFQIDSCKYKDLFTVKGRIPRQQCLELMRTSDFLLLIQGADDVSKETIPSKTYEYMHAGRPIFALIYNNEELTKMLQKLGHVAVLADNADSIRAGIRECYSRWQEGPSQKIGDSCYTVENAVSQLSTVFVEVIEKRCITEGDVYEEENHR